MDVLFDVLANGYAGFVDGWMIVGCMTRWMGGCIGQ